MKHSKYQTGLGKAMLLRSRAIFLALTLLTILTSGSAMYAGFKSGEIQKRIIDPAKQFIADMVEEYKREANKPKSQVNTLRYDYSSGTTTTTIRTINNTTTPKTTVTTKTVVFTPAPKATYYQPQTKSYEQSAQDMNASAQKAWEETLKKQEALSKEQKTKNQQWYTQTTTKNATESKAAYDAAVKKMREDAEAWKKANGF